MDHIRQFDWCSSQPDIYFVSEETLDNCVTEQILRNKFYDPLISSDSEDEGKRHKINWDFVFRESKKNSKLDKIYVPGIRHPPPYTKLSALTAHQHYQCLKVICAENPHILDTEFIPRPTKQDRKVFEEVKQIYQKEQQEYIEWAKSLWNNGLCVRVLRPKPAVEMVYEAEFKIRATEHECLPKNYEMVAQIPLETKNKTFEMVHKKDLISINVTELPQIDCLEIMKKKITIMQSSCPVPEPCIKHPCKFVLPNEYQPSILPLSEVHRELAQYALDSGCQVIASEAALRCLVELDTSWTLPISVCSVIGVDGDKHNVMVIGSEFFINKQPPQIRTYKAFRHLLEYTLVPSSEMSKRITFERPKVLPTNKPIETLTHKPLNPVPDTTVDSSDEEDNLIIDADNDDMEMNTNEEVTSKGEDQIDTQTNDNKAISQKDSQDENVKNNVQDITSSDYYSCTCKDTIFERPPPRSYKKWQIKNTTTKEHYNIVVHCSHKVKDKTGEVILEPIPEYQIDFGASKQSDGKMKSLALALQLRRNASLMNVRVDAPTGEVVTCHSISMESFTEEHKELYEQTANHIYSALDQLQGLLPGNYVLQHELTHGANALLYATKNAGATQKLCLNFDCSQLAEADEASGAKTPPTLCPVLLPCHKLRKILPCAFTPNERDLVKEPKTKKPVTKQKTPPQAIKWPKRRGRKKKKGENQTN